jgi:hypothetical protein
MIELEKYPCNDKREAEKREEEIRAERKAKLNMKKAFITEEQKKEQQKEYREENKEQILEYKKEYREANKEKIKEYNNKEYICSCGWIGTNSKKHWHLKNVIH